MQRRRMSVAKSQDGGGCDNAKRGCDDAGNCDGDGDPIVRPQHPFERGSLHWDGCSVVACACRWTATMTMMTTTTPGWVAPAMVAMLATSRSSRCCPSHRRRCVPNLTTQAMDFSRCASRIVSTRLRALGRTMSPGKGSNTPPRLTTPRRRCVVFHVATTTRIMMIRQIPPRDRLVKARLPRPDQRPSFHRMPSCRRVEG